MRKTTFTTRLPLQCTTLLLLLCHLPTVHAATDKAVSKTQIEVKGLKQAAEIVVDQWGVPHIYAKSEDDVFLAQGFNAARDRLFQIDLWRRRGLGQLSEVFGQAYLEQDRAARLFLYRGDMKKEWAAYGKQSQRLTQQFVTGINAYVHYLNQHPEQLPPEFKALNYRPALWQAEDVVKIRSHGLTRNLTSEVNRAKMACAGDLALDEVRQRLSPTWQTKLPEGLDPCLPDEVLRQFTLATQNVPFSAAITPIAKLSAEAEENRLAKLEINDSDKMEGSNNWVISPGKSATGRAMMANDPHRAYSAPSLRYITHLSAPGLDVIGAGEPALPGISIGHNGSIAFGLTIMSIDQEDLYVYDIQPDKPQNYRYQGKWVEMQKRTEVFKLNSGATMESDLFFTRHGPVIYFDTKKNKAYAVRTGWLEPGMAPYFGSVDYMRAKNFTEFKKAMLHWGAPTENQVYADTKGNIGWVPGGLTPIRPNWDGLLPVPGDGRYEWAGFLSGDKLPSSYNPEKGWFASANELNLPEDYPYRERKIGFEWPHNARYQRIADVLSQDKKVSLEDSMRLQNDILSLPAERLIRLLTAIPEASLLNQEQAKRAIQILSAWDRQENADSAAAALYQYWYSQSLGPQYKDLMLGQKSYLVTTLPDLTSMLKNLEAQDAFPPQFGDSVDQAKHRRDQLLITSLVSAYQQLEKRLGAQTQQWRWGDLQKTLFAHPFSPLLDSKGKAQYDVGPLPRGGSANSVNQSSYRLQDFVQINGPSFRVVVDVGNWDNSKAMNAPGQSGDPANPHYRDLATPWAKGEYFPLLYSRKAVEAAAKQIIELRPISRK
ncbi:penicillin acylase family protein [Undibacterium sp. LX40W]|uniref:Penicillin acylase family protein n=1 Tax=Undibacterium nitidum TaxID=2762298 RepID=A0A923HIR5_9BURK|nr:MULTISPECIES: penicillin acylase family protein [Undibacterium]MBC3880495.1 penicillin acylase family protein [Undibacterium nitidum]MBC3890769.1 penicillin acylase family protein [Undibacterium sp. LX40W]